MAQSSSSVNFRIRREVSGLQGHIERAWQRWWVKLLVVIGGLGLLGYALLWLLFARDLPSVDGLRAYEPPLPTNVRSNDGLPIHSYARERRVELAYDEYPKLLVSAFLAAEDRTFFEHHGIDYPGIVAAFVNNLRSSRRPVGASTITQQVAKNLLVGNQVSYVRKVREAILAYRIEDSLSKQQILELYLNQIPLGRNAFGVEAASHAYFDKELDELKLSQLAYLAILPKGPANYDPFRKTERALKRRNFVLSEMLRNRFIDQAQFDQASAEPIGAVVRQTPKFERVGGYFVEEVRRQLIDKFGENEKAGPFSVYSGGLWVRTSFDSRLQQYAQTALRDGLLRYDRGRGWNGPLGHVDLSVAPTSTSQLQSDDGDPVAKDGQNWAQALANTNIGFDYADWRAAIVIARNSDSFSIGFADGSTSTLPKWGAQMPVRNKGGNAFGAIVVGDIIAVAPDAGSYSLRSVPRVSGGIVVEQPQTGRVLAMQGGFDSRLGSFNRATQAMRQPGSTIKPIVYSAALENGMTPSSIIVDGPFCVYQGARLGQKCFSNFGGGRGSGPHTMRWGIEQSRNLMTVKAASQTGMERVVDTIDRMGIGRYPPFLSIALGAGETTVQRMVNAFSIIANQGRGHSSTLIDFVQDRHGKVIWPDNWRPCNRCNSADWNGKGMPRPVIRARQVIDPITAFQMVHITEGVIQRGTATVLRDLNRPMMGKTGTSTGPTNVWFIGGTPQIIAGLYIGYDKPVSLGGYAQGGTIAAPIFKQFAENAYAGLPSIPFRAPPGVRLVRVDRASGKQVYGAWPSEDPMASVIWEAFKPESEPRRNVARGDDTGPLREAKPTRRAATQSDSDFLQRQGGIY